MLHVVGHHIGFACQPCLLAVCVFNLYAIDMQYGSGSCPLCPKRKGDVRGLRHMDKRYVVSLSDSDSPSLKARSARNDRMMSLYVRRFDHEGFDLIHGNRLRVIFAFDDGKVLV